MVLRSQTAVRMGFGLVLAVSEVKGVNSQEIILKYLDVLLHIDRIQQIL